MKTRKFKQRDSIVKQENINSPIKHLGWITTERTLRVLDDGYIRQTETPDRVISVEVDGLEIPLNVDFSQALFLEFFPGFTGFRDEDSYSEVEEYLKHRGIF